VDVIVVGLNHKTAPVEIRERLSFNEHQVREGLAHLKCYPKIQEGLILSTCNRVEVYAVVGHADDGLEQVQQFLLNHAARYGDESLKDETTKSLYFLSNREAIRHGLRVASSLDSMMVGEPQILGQVKEAFDLALHQKATGVVLNKLFKKAISVAKRIRSETRIAENAVSISFAAVELAKKIFGRLSGKEVLLVGAGEMAELAVRHLLSAGIEQLMITTRTYLNAVDLAKQFGGVPLPFEEFPKQLGQADIVLCSTGAAHPVITYDHVLQAIQRRKNRPIFLIDISVPRNIDPRANDIDNVFLYDIDDLQSVVEANVQERQREALKAEEIVAEEIGSMLRWLKSLEVIPTITALRKWADDIRLGELERARKKLGRLDPAQWEYVESLATGIINKLLHTPLVVLKDEANSSNGNLYIETARRLFLLDKEASSDRKSEVKDAGDTEEQDGPQPAV
jgi:glutamyl-tRNA reductase